ncbi:ATP-dependent helicase [Patescibacteria group bacterium]|nr:ATP-dependent helicase [Patescibacteria group bacterium]
MKNNKLNSEQIRAVKHLNGPLLIIAGAGTGKTTVITERIKYLILKKLVPPSQILALTFTEKAALEMEERVDKEMPYGYTQMWISTFHSFCDRILRQEAIHIGLNPTYKLMTEAEAILLLRKNLFQLKLNYFRPMGNPTKFLSALVQHFSRLKDEDVSPDEYFNLVTKLKKNKHKDLEKKLEIEKLEELANTYAAYENLKATEGAMDFSDLISNTLKLFKKRENVLKGYQKQFRYVLVDEFQDTNYAQNKLAVLLAGEKKNITVVGDDDQSIYRFRGSSISNILQFKKQFPKAKVIALTQNYRSTKEILDSSYDLIQFNNPDRLEIKEKINKKLIPFRKERGEKVEFIYSKRVDDEADAVAEKIRSLSQKKQYQYNDFAILVRANDHAQPFMRALERKKIPFQFLGPGKLFHQEEVKDLIAYLKVLCNFEDSTSLYRVINMPVFGLDAVEVATLLNLAKKKGYSLFETMENANETCLRKSTLEKNEVIVRMIKKHLKLVPKESAGQILYYFLKDSGLLKEIIDSKSINNETKAGNIAKLFDKLKSYEIDHKTSSVFEIIDWIDLSMQMGESPLAADLDWSENNAVNILTVHSGKGLEFPVVFLVNLVSQRFPTRERKEAIPIPQEFIKEILPTGDYHLEEERRLFYVGMTRAKDKLFLTAANYYGEGKKERKISPFVYEALGHQETEEILQKKQTGQLTLLDLSHYDLTMEEPKPVLTRPITYLSYSQIQTFEICPLHYKLRYILKIPTAQSSAQSFGTSIHAALRDFYQAHMAGQELDQDDIDEAIVKNWINEGYQNKEHQKKALEKAKKIVSQYIKEEFNKQVKPAALETPFIFNLNGIKVGGRVDRIDNLNDKSIEIIDYKTGLNAPTEKSLTEDLQLTIYALAATEIKESIFNKKPEDVKLSLYYLETQQKFTTIRTKDQLDKAKEKIINIANLIGSSDFACSKTVFCKKCEYNMLCKT